MINKMINNLNCPYCDKECTKKDEYTVTRRKTKQYFHRACYEADTRRDKS